MKKKTIQCDNCGTRINHIPEKCPQCGELLHDRMDEQVRRNIKKRMEATPLLIRLYFLWTYLLVFPFYALGVYLKEKLNTPEAYHEYTISAVFLFSFLIGTLYTLLIIKCISHPIALKHSLIHFLLYLSAALVGANTRGGLSPVTSCILLLCVMFVFIQYFFMVYLQKTVFKIISWAALLLFALSTLLFHNYTWYFVQKIRLRSESYDNRNEILTCLEEIATTRTTELLSEMLLKDQNSGLRYSALKILVERRDECR